jgi:hypothetical protein
MYKQVYTWEFKCQLNHSEPPRTDLNGGPGTNQKSPEALESTMVSEIQEQQLPPELPL